MPPVRSSRTTHRATPPASSPTTIHATIPMRRNLPAARKVGADDVARYRTFGTDVAEGDAAGAHVRMAAPAHRAARAAPWPDRRDDDRPRVERRQGDGATAHARSGRPRR